MTSWQAGYWRVFNVLVRALGLTALVAGAGFTVLGAVRILQLGLAVEGTPRVVILLIGLLVAALGAAMLRAPTYRPDLGDVSWQFDPFGAKSRSPSKRSWWTGDQ